MEALWTNSAGRITSEDAGKALSLKKKNEKPMPLMPRMPRIPLVVEARNALNRRRAAAILREDLAAGEQTGGVWRTVSQAAAQLGEHGLSLEAAKRVAATAPLDVDHVLFYAVALLNNGRLEAGIRQVDGLPASAQSHPAILHFRAMVATQMGNFALAESLLRAALAVSPAPVLWLALAIARTFKPGDKEIVQMEALLPRVAAAPPQVRAQLFYALGKAYDDVGDIAKAADAYANGARLISQASPAPNWRQLNDFASQLIDGYTTENMAKLTPSGADGRRMIFVTGFPRSGTTLVEHVLTSHSEVNAGAELNLVPVALIPSGAIDTRTSAGDYSFDDALAYQARSDSPDPWGDLGRDYLQMAEERFGAHGRAVDKTLNLGSFMGLLLHMLPGSKVVWLRRNPEDCALSIFRTHSQYGSLPWSYSLKNIAEFFRIEDRLYAHWAQMFPDRILTVPYESLVSDPQDWIGRILAHLDLKPEPQVFEPHKSTRAVATASLAQVRAPISTKRIGAADVYAAFAQEFRQAYYI